MFDLKLTRQQVSEYAAGLGSDCAFFAWDRPMMGSGRGEILSPYDLNINIVEVSDAAPGSYELRIVVPEGIEVSTAEAYRGIKPAVPAVRLEDVLAKPVPVWKDLLVNDFEATVFEAHPELAAIKQSLYDSGAAYASMSGSGSALFALYEV